jgi:hypothetical protein
MANAFVYQAALFCEACGESIRANLRKVGKAPADADDEGSYDSDDYPKGPFADGGGEADFPNHCDCGEDCDDAIVLSDGRKIGAWLGNPLTSDGVDYVRGAVEKGGEVATLWADWYSDDLS